MKDDQLIGLIDKYLAGEATDLEKQQLNQWYNQTSDQEAIWNVDFDSEDELLEKRMLYHLKVHVRAKRHKVFRIDASFLKIAAALFIGTFLIGGLFLLKNGKSFDNQQQFSASAPVQFAENKFVLLPDSSTVLLRSGSSISYNMKGKIRSLELVGEAYFDIKHLPNHPFMIYTGKVITTVLGTSFNIKAYPGQNIIVSVTRGKVSVANGKDKVFTTLLPNQQVIFTPAAEKLNQSTIIAKETITWAKQDMQFDGISYGLLADRLSRRYGVIIKFKNPALERCLVTGRFTGTESLDQVLKTLSDFVGSTYTIDGKTVLLDGTGCN